MTHGFHLLSCLGKRIYIDMQVVIIIGLPKTSSSYVHMARQLGKGSDLLCDRMSMAQTVTKLDR